MLFLCFIRCQRVCRSRQSTHWRDSSRFGTASDDWLRYSSKVSSHDYGVERHASPKYHYGFWRQNQVSWKEFDPGWSGNWSHQWRFYSRWFSKTVRHHTRYRYRTESFAMIAIVCSDGCFWLVAGRHDKCEAAKAALIALIPVSIEVPVPYDLHRFIIGQKGKDVREMMNTYDVNIKGSFIAMSIFDDLFRIA